MWWSAGAVPSGDGDKPTDRDLLMLPPPTSEMYILRAERPSGKSLTEAESGQNRKLNCTIFIFHLVCCDDKTHRKYPQNTITCLRVFFFTAPQILQRHTRCNSFYVTDEFSSHAATKLKAGGVFVVKGKTMSRFSVCNKLCAFRVAVHNVSGSAEAQTGSDWLN